MRRLTVGETIDQVLSLVKPANRRDEALGWSTSCPPGECPCACRFCGDPAMVEILSDGDRVRVAVGHDVPICPEFVQACENVE